MRLAHPHLIGIQALQSLTFSIVTLTAPQQSNGSLIFTETLEHTSCKLRQPAYIKTTPPFQSFPGD